MKTLALTFAFLGAVACSNPTAPEVQVTGTVRDFGRGGLFVIQADEGATYEPINLWDCLKRDGLRVETTLRVRSDMASIHMVGPVVEIRALRTLDVVGPCALGEADDVVPRWTLESPGLLG